MAICDLIRDGLQPRQPTPKMKYKTIMATIIIEDKIPMVARSRFTYMKSSAVIMAEAFRGRAFWVARRGALRAEALSLRAVSWSSSDSPRATMTMEALALANW